MKLIEIRNGKGGYGISMKAWLGDGKDKKEDAKLTVKTLGTAAGLVVTKHEQEAEQQVSMLNAGAIHALYIVAMEHNMTAAEVIDIYMKDMEQKKQALIRAWEEAEKETGEEEQEADHKEE